MKIILFANTEWYLFNFRLALAKALAARGHEVVMVSPPGPYGEKLESEGFRWVPVKMNRRGLNPFSELQVISRLYKIFRKEKPDLVHNFTIKCVVYGSLAAKLCGGVGVVNAVAGLGYVFSSSSFKARFLRPFVRFLLGVVLTGRNTRLILQNPEDEGLFLSSGLASRKYTHLIKGSGVDTSRFSPRNKDDGGQIKVLLATRLLWDKGINEYVQAAALLTGQSIKATFMLAGAPDDGNPDAVHQSQIDKWSESGLIRALGHVDDMDGLLQEVDIVVLPTIYGEGVPRILLEAAASGLPLVATDMPGCREIVIPGVSGFLVEPRNAEDLAEAIKKAILDKELRHKLGMGARKLAEETFDERKVISDTLSVYAELATV